MCSVAIVLIVVAFLPFLPFQSSVVCFAWSLRLSYQWSIPPQTSARAPTMSIFRWRWCSCLLPRWSLTQRNIARCGSFTSKSVLYRTCLGIRAFSIQPQTLNNCLRSSFATSNRWSLWSSVPEYDRESDNSLLCDCGQTTKSITLYIGTTWPVVTSRRCPCHVVLCRAECWNAVLQRNKPCTSRKSASAIPFMFRLPRE